MRALRLYGARDARIDDLAEPDIGSGSVKLEVEWAGICGTDLKLYLRGQTSERHPLIGEQGPHVLGHEMSGRVTAIADDVQDISIGDLVVVRPNLSCGTCSACRRSLSNLCKNWAFLGIHGGGGGFSETMVVPRECIYRLPDGIGSDAAALTEVVAVGWRAVKRSGANAGDSAIVVGAGPIGLAVVLCLREHGVNPIIVCEPAPVRAKLAESFGATVVNEEELSTALSQLAPDGVAVGFDAAGVSSVTFATAFNAVRKGGSVVAVARVETPIDFNVGDLLFSEKSLTGSFAYTHEDFTEAVNVMSRIGLDLSKMISRRVSLEDVVEEGFKRLLGENRAREVKILVSPKAFRSQLD